MTVWPQQEEPLWAGGSGFRLDAVRVLCLGDVRGPVDTQVCSPQSCPGLAALSHPFFLALHSHTILVPEPQISLPDQERLLLTPVLKSIPATHTHTITFALDVCCPRVPIPRPTYCPGPRAWSTPRHQHIPPGMPAEAGPVSLSLPRSGPCALQS